MSIRFNMHDSGLHPLKLFLTTQASTFTLLLLGTFLTGGISTGDVASGTSHDRSDLQELLEKLETIVTSSSSHSAVAPCPGSECQVNADGRSSAPSSAALASSVDEPDANRRDDGGALLPAEASRKSQALDAGKSPLAARLQLIEQLLRQEQLQQKQDDQPPMADTPTEILLTRGFDRHGRLFGEIPSAPAVRWLDKAQSAEREQLDGLSAAGDSHARNGEQDGTRVMSLLAKLLQQQQQLNSGGQQLLHESLQPSQAPAAADSAPDRSLFSLGSSQLKPLQQEVMAESPSPSSSQKSDQQHGDQQQKTLADAVMQLVSVVRDLVEDEQRIRDENEEMLDTVVSIAALEARHRLAGDRRTRLEAAMEAGSPATDS